MLVRNVHERLLDAPPDVVGGLLDSLASPDDRLWPHDRWPAMRLDRPLQAGAAGGHGPIRYTVAAYQPARYVEFRFDAPRGFGGYHAFVVERAGSAETLLRHLLVMRASGPARLSWPLAYRWLHDALIEDALDRAARAVGAEPPARQWALWVLVLRALLAQGRWLQRQLQGATPARRSTRRRPAAPPRSS